MPFTVITLVNAPAALRGDLTKWMQEIATGVYVGNFNQRVREEIWLRVCCNIKNGEATISYATPNEIGYEFKTHCSSRCVIHLDGLPLVKIPMQSTENISNENLTLGYSQASKQRKARKYNKQTINHQKNSTQSYVILDIETTGLDVQHDHIIEIGAIWVKGEELREFHTLVCTHMSVTSNIMELTGINNEMLDRKGVSIEEALSELCEFIGEEKIVGYNISFDTCFINRVLQKIGRQPINNRTLDLLKLVKREKKYMLNYQLSSVLHAYGIQKQVQHRALKDCYLLHELISKLNKFDEHLT